jgi:lipopolysaccharide/colanic/teichoic acid biosynthesis glycosyltransferase
MSALDSACNNGTPENYERPMTVTPHRRVRTPPGKRWLDLVVAILALMAVAPIILAAAALIWLTNPGPAFYRQTRIGLHEKPFTMFKLRTMRIDGNDRAQHLAWASYETGLQA